MTGSTIKAGTDRMKSTAQATRNGGSWAGWCLSAAGRFVGWPGGADTAAEAYGRSTVVSTDPAAAPAGAVHWWTDGGPGHVAVSLGRRRTFMASSWVTKANGGEVWHPALGVVDVAAYTAAHRSLIYRGWSADLDHVVMADLILLVQVPGDVAVWQITPGMQRRVVTKLRLAIFKRRGVTPVAVARARLEAFRKA